MVRALIHVRSFLAALALGLLIAFSVAPAMTFASPSCSETAAARSDESGVDAHFSRTRSGFHQSGHADMAGDCCMSGIATHCCGVASTPADSEYVAVEFSAVAWPASPAHRLRGRGPFGDFRPPKHIG